MKKSRLMKILVITTLAVVLLGVATISNAAENTGIIITSGNTSSDVVQIGNDTSNTASNTNVAPTTNTTTNSVSNYNVTPVNNTTSELPKTGESDIYIAGALLVVLGIAAVYTYKKVRDYNM